MAPESRYVKPSRCATARATVDLPAPAGPSMATTVMACPGRAGSLGQAPQVLGKARIGHLGGVGALHGHPFLRGQAGHGAQEGEAMVTVSPQPSAPQGSGPTNNETIMQGFNVDSQSPQALNHRGDPV